MPQPPRSAAAGPHHFSPCAPPHPSYGCPVEFARGRVRSGRIGVRPSAAVDTRSPGPDRVHPRLRHRLRRLHGRQRRAAGDPARSRWGPRSPAVAGRRLSVDARVSPPRRRLARRSLRRATAVPDRDRLLRADVDPVRGCARRDAVDSRPRPAGRCGRTADTRRARRDRVDLQRRGARSRDRSLDGVDGRRVRDWTAGRRLARHARVVALGVHHQRAVRGRDRSARGLRRAEDPPRRQACEGRRTRRDSLRDGSRRTRLRADRGATPRVRRPTDPGDALRRHRRARRLPALGAPRTTADVAAAALPATKLFVREPRDARGLRRTVHPDVLPLVLYLQQIAGYSALRSGLALVPITGAGDVLPPPRVGRLSMRLGPRLFMGTGPFIAAAALLPMVTFGRSFSYWPGASSPADRLLGRSPR